MKAFSRAWAQILPNDLVQIGNLLRHRQLLTGHCRRQGGRWPATALPTQSGTTFCQPNTNRSWGLPVQYLARDRSEADWIVLRDALATKRISEEDPEEEFAQSARDLLATVDATSEVATAKVNLDSNIAAVQTAWNLAASE